MLRQLKVLLSLGVCLFACGSASRIDAQPTNYSAQLFSAASNYTGMFGSIGAGSLQMQEGCGVAVNPTNNDIFISDFGNSRIEMWTATGQWIGAFTANSGVNDRLLSPCGLAFAPNGNLYVADPDGNHILVFQPLNPGQTAWGVVSAFGQYGTNPGQLHIPYGVAILHGSSPSNFLVYVADTYNNRIAVFNASGQFVSEFGQSGSGNGQLNFPIGLAFDASNNLVVTDEFNNRLQKFSSGGIYMGQFGGTGQAPPNPLLPFGIAICPQTAGAPYAGRIMVADIANSRVVVYSSGGAYVAQFDLRMTGSQLVTPLAIAFFSDGRQVITDEIFNNNNNGGGGGGCGNDCVTVKK